MGTLALRSQQGIQQCKHEDIKYELCKHEHEAIPEHARKKALMAYDLVLCWQEFRANFNGKKSEADEAFVSLYKAGQLVRHLKDVLGEVSVKTLYRWSAELGDSKDWRRLIDAYYLPKNRQERLTEQEANVFKLWLLHENKLSIAQAIRQTRLSLLAMGIKCEKSDMTFRRWASEFEEKNKALFVSIRDGDKARKDGFDPYVIRNAFVLEVGDCFVLDGHKLNCMVKSPETGKPVRPILIGVLDWKSWDLMGYEVMLTENTQSIASAYRHAVLYLGHPSRVVYIDNGKAFKARFFTKTADLTGMTGLYHRLGVEVVTAKPYNARAKVIEPWFNILSGRFERLIPSYSGASIVDKPARHRRNERLAQWVHKVLTGDYVPTLIEFVEMLEQWLWLYREMNECPNNKGYTIRQTVEAYRQTERYKEMCQGFDMAALDDLMMEQKQTQIYPNGVRLFGDFYYHSSLAGLKGQKTTVRYSILQREYVKVMHPIEMIWVTAQKVNTTHPVARVLGSEKDREILQHEIKRTSEPAKIARQEVKEVIEEIKETKKQVEDAIQRYVAERFKDMAWHKALPSEAQKVQEQEAGRADIGKLLPEEVDEVKKTGIVLFESDL